ncbi:hypothetical protein KEM52_004608 [Ascosphaera acerosa]|nr:hypothetical protein KEM52_004608 [Ascosphaera acerosa]
MSRTKKGAISSRSRAARREAEEALLQGDKSLESVPRADDRPAALNAHKNAGVTKKSKEKRMTRAQKRRQQRGIARAAEVIEKTETKVEKSKARASTVQERRAAWEQVNVIKKKDDKKVGAIVAVSAEKEGDQDMEDESAADAAQAADEDVDLIE